MVPPDEGSDVIVSPAVTLRESDPPVPPMVNVEAPGGVPAGTLTDNVAVPPGAIETGVNVPVTPDGSPVIDRSTVLANPFTADTATE
jgi:hypothetical protein